MTVIRLGSAVHNQYMTAGVSATATQEAELQNTQNKSIYLELLQKSFQKSTLVIQFSYYIYVCF